MALLPLPAGDEEFTLEIRDASPAHFLTKIKSFSLLSEHGISKLESMEFEAGDYKWKLIIYPDGDKTAKEVGHISVYLSMVRPASQPAGWEVNAIFNFFLYNHISDNYLCFRGKLRRFHALNSKCGISKLMSKKCFTEPANGILLNDKCVFGAEVFVIKNQRVMENVSVLALHDPCTRTWEIYDFSKKDNVWKSEEFSAGGYKWKLVIHPKGLPRVQGRYVSIFLECVESKSFGAHKKVRATCLFILRNRLHSQKNHSKKATQRYSSSESDWGFTEFVGIEDVGDPSKGFNLKDALQFEIQLSVEAIQEPL